MSFNSLGNFIESLEKNGELIRISGFVDPVLEMSEITDRFSKLPAGGKALLFENTGTRFPVIMNSLGSEKRMCLALGIKELDEVTEQLSGLLALIPGPGKSLLQKMSVLPSLIKLSGFMPYTSRRSAPCQEVIHTDPDLGILPVLQTWPFDGGRFFTFPMVHTLDPETGTRNVGMYRMQVFSKNTTGMHWHRHKTGALHFEKYRKLGRRMPVAVAFGGDPALTYAATAPLPDQVDELLFAGFLRKKGVRLVKARTQDILIPAEADIIVEGYVDPAEEFKTEGPFGDHTGFYSLEDLYPVLHVTCITHRRNAVFPATVVGIPPMEDAWIAKATERIFLWPIKKTLCPELTDINIPEFGVAHNLTLVSIDKTYPGQAAKVMNALWGAGQMMFNKFMVVSSEHEQIWDFYSLVQKISELDFRRALFFTTGPLDVLDHAAPGTGYGSKMGIDLTPSLPGEPYLIHKPILTDHPVRNQKLILSSEFSGKKYPGTGFLLLNVIKSDRSELHAAVLGYLDHLTDINPRIIVLFDETVELSDYRIAAWIALNNIDPARDIRLYARGEDSILVADAMTKDPGYDDFARRWPNLITMSDEVIHKIDQEWNDLIPYPFIPSPSLRFKKMIKNARASVIH